MVPTTSPPFVKFPLVRKLGWVTGVPNFPSMLMPSAQGEGTTRGEQKKTMGGAMGWRPRMLNNFMAIDGLQSNTGEIRCHFCGGNHLTAKCRSDRTTPLQRRDKAMKAGLCLNCLQEGHFSRNCRLPKGCSRQGCGKRHHTLLHSTQANGGTSRPYGQGRPRQ